MKKMNFEEFTKLRKELSQGVLDYLRSKDISYHVALIILEDVKNYFESDMRDNIIR